MGLPSYILPIMGKGSVYDPIVTAWLAQLTTSFGSNPSTAFIDALNDMIAGMRTDGDVLLLDRFWIFAQEVQGYSTISIVNPSSTALTEVNTPTWTANQGYTFDGSSEFLDTNYTPSTDGVNWTLNSASMGLYIMSNADGVYIDIGATSAASAKASYNYSRAGNLTYQAINKSAGSTNIGNGNSIGLYHTQRRTSAATDFIKNGTLLTTDTVVSSSVTEKSLFVGALNFNGAATLYSPRKYSMVFTGSGGINYTNFYNRFNTFRTAIGF